MHAWSCERRFGIAMAVLLATAILGLPSPARAADEASQFPQVVHVSQTFDSQPFEYRILDRTEKTGYVVYRLTYPSPRVTSVLQNNTIPAEYYVPAGLKPSDPPRPAVICLHILDGNLELVRLTSSVLASHGIPSILFLLPYYGERAMPEGPKAMASDPRLFLSAIDQAMVDVKRTVDVLASRPEVDPNHIGITGISLGGIVSATAARLDPRLSRAVLILAGGDVNTIIHFARETRELSQLIKALPPEQKADVEATITALDPLSDAQKLRDRALNGKVLMVNAEEDQVIPPECTRKLAAALGIEDRVVWLKGLGHYTALAELPRILRMTTAFFAQDMPKDLTTTPPPPRQHTPLEVVTSVVQQAVGFFSSEPTAGRCHFVDLDVQVALGDGKTYEGHLQFIRGDQHRFKLQGKLPTIGEVAVGQGSAPWMTSVQKTLFQGTDGDTTAPTAPLQYANPKHLTKVRMLGGLAAGLALAPDMLEQLVTITEETSSDGQKSVRLDLKKRGQGTFRVSLADDQKTPTKITFNIAKVQGTITVRSWQTNTVAHAAMFEPPAGLTVKEVKRDDLYRIFSSLFNFAMENAP